MRKLVVTLFAMVLAFGMSALAQNDAGTAPDKSAAKAEKKQAKTEKKEEKAEKKETKAAEKGKALSLTGWVKTEGDKTVFVNDKDKKSWDVQDPDMLKAENGKHVRVKAKLDEANKSMNVSSVKELGKRKQARAGKSLRD